MSKDALIIAHKPIEEMIHEFRGHRVMLDSDLAEHYGVTVKVLNQAVRRNEERFPEDFIFVLTNQEYARLRSQTVTSNGHGGRRYLPIAFTENGVAMLSSVLRSSRAIKVNIEIMRAFTRRFSTHDDAIRSLFAAIKRLMQKDEPSHRPIGF